MQKIKLKK